MKVIFYDRKNKREVSNEELMPTNVVESIVVVDCDDENQPESFEQLYIKENQIGELAYKSGKCSDCCNWDQYLMESDLIFLRIEE